MRQRVRRFIALIMSTLTLLTVVPITSYAATALQYTADPQRDTAVGTVVYKGSKGTYLCGIVYIPNFGGTRRPFFGIQSHNNGGNIWSSEIYYTTELVYDSYEDKFAVTYFKGSSERGFGEGNSYTSKDGYVSTQISKNRDTDKIDDLPSWVPKSDVAEAENQYASAAIIFKNVSDPDIVIDSIGNSDVTIAYAAANTISKYIADEGMSVDELKMAIAGFSGTKAQAWESLKNVLGKCASAGVASAKKDELVSDVLSGKDKNGLAALYAYIDKQDNTQQIAGNETKVNVGKTADEGPSTLLGNLTADTEIKESDGYDVDENGNTLDWLHWYIAAYHVGTNTPMTGKLFNNVLVDKKTNGVKPVMNSNGQAVPLYGSYENLSDLADMSKDASKFRKMYEILSIASISMDSGTMFKEWFGDGDVEAELNNLWERISVHDNQGKYVMDSDALQGLLDDINAYTNITNDDMKRFATISQRLKVLLINMSQNDTPLSGSGYEWITSFYTGNSNFIYTDLIADTFIPLLMVNGTDSVQVANNLGDNQVWAAWYAIQTIYEIPYFMQMYMVEMNDLISANTEMANNDLYKAIKSIHDAKEDLKMPVLDYLWTKEMEPLSQSSNQNIQYKTLEKIWEEMHKLDSSAGDITGVDAQEPLETGKPMKWFFKDYLSGKLSDYYLQGVAYTATLVPMRSNVYSKEWLKYMDYDFFEHFYYRWGFNRKALYMDRSSGAGENYFTQEGSNKAHGRLKVCTLRDLIESKGDVVLYLDDNFYNCQEIQERYNSMQIAGSTQYNSGALDVAMSTDEMTSESGNNEKHTDNFVNRHGWWTTVAENIEELYNTDFENIVKTNESTNYSKTFYNMISKLENGHQYYPEATAENVGNNDNAVLSSGRINYYLNSENAGSEVYSPIQGYAVVSSVYRDADLFNKANSYEIQRPVFIASQTAPYMKNATLEACETIFNWALLKNLKDAMPVGYAGNIDMDCPVYMDILGNVVTESGTVVIPATANATLMNPATYCQNMYAAGLFAIYGMDYYIPKKDNESTVFQQMMSTAFELDDTGKYYIASPRTIGDATKVDMSRLSATSKSTLDILYTQTFATLFNMEDGTSGYNFDSFFNICMEVLRGAPIESIDKKVEGIDTSGRIDRAGIVAAAKLEELNEALATGAENTTLYIPNIAFMPGMNYIAMMAFKILMLIVTLVSMVTVYFDAVSESLGVNTMMKCISAMLITMITLFTVPAVFEATYYQSNRALLQDEAIRIAMLNYEKESAGVEIGVSEVKEPDISTELYLKLEDIDIPWYELFYNSIFSNSYAQLSELYDDYGKKHSFVANADDVEVKNDGVYVDILNVFNSSSVDLSMNVPNTDMRRLVQTAGTQTTSLSFFSPYYAILDALIQNVNYYNENPWGDNSGDAASGTTGWYSYTVTEQKGGKVKTMGLIEPYLTSEKFLYDDAKDPLGLKFMYQNISGSNYAPDPAIAGFYSAQNMSSMRRSGWYADSISSAECDKRLEYMTEHARRFVAKNRELLGKISDDTFLKAMALDMAMEHNKVFGAKTCDSLEIYNLSNDDLVRLSVADRDDVMVNSTLSYPRFIYTVGGSPAVFAAALLSMVMWVSGIVKPLLVIVAFLTIFVSIFIFRVCMRKEGTSLYGYLITALLLSFTNICYSIMLKASMFLPMLHFTPFMCIIVQIILQITYMVILLNVVGTAFKDWRDLGYARYASKTQDMHIGLINMFNKTKNSNNPFYGGSTKISNPEQNWNYYDEMMEERKRRSR